MSCKKSKNHKFTEDLKLSDFADSKFGRFRPKKSSSNKTETMQTEVNFEWDDVTDDELDLVECENDDGSKSMVVAKRSKKYIKSDENICENEPVGVEYPVAVWFLISEYVKPEDVGRFAGICKGSLFATTYAKFWHDLYKNYCKPTTVLPDRLKPDNMVRRYGLRSSVIRSLFHTYSVFVSRKPSQQFCTPQDLLKRRCTTMWYQKYKDQWVFFFKLKLVDNPLYRSRHKSVPKKDWLTILDDIQANPEESCQVLRVVCGSFSDAPLVMGMTLRLLQTSLSPNMRNHRLTLGFSSGYQEQPECLIVLDAVVKTQVMDWWHPHYPHSGEYLPPPTLSQSNFINCKFDFNAL